MHNQATILRRYVALSLAVTAAEQAGDLAREEAGHSRFWSFVDRYMYSVPIASVREADQALGLSFPAFC